MWQTSSDDRERPFRVRVLKTVNLADVESDVNEATQGLSGWVVRPSVCRAEKNSFWNHPNMFSALHLSIFSALLTKVEPSPSHPTYAR